MEQHALIAVADAECLRHLVRGKALDVAQGDHSALLLGQLLDRREDRVARLSLEELLLGRLPLAWPEHPAAGELVVGAEEPIGIDRRLVGPGRRREGNRPRLALTARLCGV